MLQESVSVKTRKQLFEEGILAKNPKEDLTRTKNKYRNQRVEAMWQGFNMAHDVALAKHAPGSYILGKLISMGNFQVPQFSRKPWSHSTYTAARKEADRIIAGNREANIAIYYRVDVIEPDVLNGNSVSIFNKKTEFLEYADDGFGNLIKVPHPAFKYTFSHYFGPHGKFPYRRQEFIKGK